MASACAVRPRISGRLPGALLVLIVLATGCVLATAYHDFLSVSRHLWHLSVHDRNAHYLSALRLATGLRHGDLVACGNEVLHADVWPPLHAILTGTFLAMAGTDYRLAVLPSLLAWGAAAVLAFVIGRRIAPRGGSLAGAIAALLILTSPCHRGLATDIMLESLGACLALAALYYYLRACQEGSTRAWRGLAWVLTALFLHKYNYWLLTVLALLAADLAENFPSRWACLRAVLSRLSLSTALSRELRRPLTLSFVAVTVLSIALVVRGNKPLTLAGQSVSVYPPHNIIHIAYVFLFLRLCQWWRRGGRDWARSHGPSVRQLVYGHAWPVLLYLLMPRRPGNFLWYLSTANGETGHHGGLAEGIRYYARPFLDDYHATSLGALLALVLFVVALVPWRRLRPGGIAVLFFAVFGAALTLYHPNRQTRFLHTWLPALWIGAGVGVSTLIPQRPWGPALGRAIPGLVAAVALALAVAPGLFHPRPAPEGGPQRELPCFLDVTDTILRELEGPHRALVLSEVALKPQAQWTVLERFGCLDKLDEYWYGFAEDDVSNCEGFRRWLQSAKADTLAYVERMPDCRFHDWCDQLADCRAHAELAGVLREQWQLRLIRRCPLPRQGCVVSIWRRQEDKRAQKNTP